MHSHTFKVDIVDIHEVTRSGKSWDCVTALYEGEGDKPVTYDWLSPVGTFALDQRVEVEFIDPHSKRIAPVA